MTNRRTTIAAVGLLTLISLSTSLSINLSGHASGQELSSRRGDYRLPFQQRSGLIYVKARVNGKPVSLLLDTGSTVTLFALRLVPMPSESSRVAISLAKGSVSAFSIPVGFSLGDSDLPGRSCVFYRNAIFGDFQFPDADGLLGEDILSRFKSVTFDFKNSTLILENP